MDPPGPGQASDNKKIKPPTQKMRVYSIKKKGMCRGRGENRIGITAQRLVNPRLGSEKMPPRDIPGFV
jgi:hypothetical protein